MNPTEEWLNGCLKSIKHEIFKDVIKVSADVTPMNDGQVVIVSDINRVTLTLETSSGEKRTLKAIAKFEPPPGPGKDLADDCDVFQNETMMYLEVLKEMERMMSEVGDNKYPWPEVYHCSDNKLLVQDLCEIGYRVVPTYEFLSPKHAYLVMEALGKFHALSMIMDSRETLNKSKLNPGYLMRGPPFIVNLYNLGVEALARDIKKSWGPEWASVPDRLKNFMTDTKEKITKMAAKAKGKWDVLNHGDFNMRNMLFHFQPGSRIPDDVKFVDFQMTHYNSLGFDLSNILYSSLLPLEREENMDTLLIRYTDSLAQTCKLHRYEGRVPDMIDVVDSIRSLNIYSTFTSFCFIPFFVVSGSEDMQKQADDHQDMFNSEISLEDEGTGNICDVYYKHDKARELIKYEVTRWSGGGTNGGPAEKESTVQQPNDHHCSHTTSPSYPNTKPYHDHRSSHAVPI